jgi:hypothetical protein
MAEVAVSQADKSPTPTAFNNRSGTRAGLKLGFFLALVMALLFRLAPQPAGSVLFWVLLGIQTARGDWIIWRRLRLPWILAGGVSALFVSGAMIPISIRGLDLATMMVALPLAGVVVVWTALLFVPLSLGLEALRNSPEWRAWASRTERATLWEMLTFQHVPDMRSTVRRSI